MYIIQIVAILSFLFIQSQCQINDLKLSRMFLEEHAAKLREEASERAPGEHNHELGLLNSMIEQHEQQRIPQQLSQSPSQNLMSNFNKFTPNSMQINNFATTGIRVTERIMASRQAQQDPATTTTNPLNNFNIVSQLKAPARFCPFKNAVKCDVQFPYRSLDGSCNNLNNLWWGQSETPFKRYLEADYSDRNISIVENFY